MTGLPTESSIANVYLGDLKSLREPLENVTVDYQEIDLIFINGDVVLVINDEDYTFLKSEYILLDQFAHTIEITKIEASKRGLL